MPRRSEGLEYLMGNGFGSSQEQRAFIADRWEVFEEYLDPDETKGLTKRWFLVSLTARRAEELIQKFRALVKVTERSFYEQHGVRGCGTCKMRKMCEYPANYPEKGKACPGWAPDPRKLAMTYESFMSNVAGRLCRFRNRNATLLGRPIDYLPGEGILARMEDGEVRTFLFGEQILVEILE